MKKVIYGVLAAAMVLNAGMATARAHDPHKGHRGEFQFAECNGVFDDFKTSSHIAKYCSRILPKQGIISEKGGAGKTWGEAFPDAWMINPNDNDKSGTVKANDVMLNHSGGKFVWQRWIPGGISPMTGNTYKAEWKDVIRTKKIDDKNIVNYVLNVKGGISPNAMTNAAKKAYKDELQKYFVNQTADLDKASSDAKKDEFKAKLYKECTQDMTAVAAFGFGNVMCNVFK